MDVQRKSSIAMYSIASYFSIEARQAAASERYETFRTLAPGTFGRTRQGCCPTGILLRADGYGMKYTQPDAEYAASAVYARWKVGKQLSRIEGPAAHRVMCTAMAEFIAAFDSGEIADLEDALGVAAARQNTAPAPRKASTRIGQRP